MATNKAKAKTKIFGNIHLNQEYSNRKRPLKISIYYCNQFEKS